MAQLLVLSHYQADQLLAARRVGATTAVVSPDLRRTTVDVALDEVGVTFPGGETVTWPDLARIAEAERKCFLVEDGQVEEIAFFSETTGWLRSLMPTEGAPTMLVSGISMHRFKGIDPYEDTLRKVKTIAPLVGRVLDTATGLGYTAIEAARTAQEVVTIELDPSGLEVARYNPWSQDLFTRPNIRQIVGDTYEIVPTFPDTHFTRIIHDPPAFGLAGDLYSGAFYRELYRVLSRGGRLFHYIGDLDSKSGHRVTTGAVRRLQEAGFKNVRPRPEAFGVVGHK
jgi:predicted methyltransferase